MAAIRVSEQCPQCSEELILRRNRRTGDPFVSCSAYPDCTFSEGIEDRTAKLSAVIHSLNCTIEKMGKEKGPALPPGAADIADRGLRKLVAKWHPDRKLEKPITRHELVASLNVIIDEMRKVK